MQRAWNEIRRLSAVGAVHNRKGFTLASRSPEAILEHASDELLELTQAPNDIDELGDTLACLLHYAIRKNWSLDQIEDALLKKLTMRFTEVNDGACGQIKAEVGQCGKVGADCNYEKEGRGCGES